MTRQELVSDYRVNELLSALNEGLLELEFVKRKLMELTGSAADLVRYSDGQYGILEI